MAFTPFPHVTEQSVQGVHWLASHPGRKESSAVRKKENAIFVKMFGILNFGAFQFSREMATFGYSKLVLSLLRRRRHRQSVCNGPRKLADFRL